jgi:hypothetical protein
MRCIVFGTIEHGQRSFTGAFQQRQGGVDGACSLLATVPGQQRRLTELLNLGIGRHDQYRFAAMQHDVL